jgi:hypothetical protein
VGEDLSGDKDDSSAMVFFSFRWGSRLHCEIDDSHKTFVNRELAHVTVDFIFAMTENRIFVLAKRPFQEGDVVVLNGGKVLMMLKTVGRLPRSRITKEYHSWFLQLQCLGL